MFDVDAFANWLLADEDLAVSYVELQRLRVAYLERHGVSWPKAMQVPDQAREELRPVLAELKRQRKECMVRELQKTFNLFAKWRATTDASWKGVKWELAQIPRRRLNPYTPAELRRLADACRPGFRGTRHACIVWLMANATWRKGELHSLSEEDLDEERCAILLMDAEKHGEPGWVPLPRNAWAKGLPLQRWLAAKHRVAGRGGPLWVNERGEPMTLAGFAGDMHDLRVRSGVAANFNRFRHTRGTIHEEVGTPTLVAQRDFRHRDPRNTLHYMHGSLQARRDVLRGVGFPGFEDEPQRRPVGEVWRDLGLPSKPAVEE